MSAPLNIRDPAVTNLGYEKLDRDLYPTPNWMAESLLNAGVIPEGYGIWEPAAGPGALVFAARKRGFHVVASDIFPNSEINDFTSDFLTCTQMPPGIAQGAIWTNPPFGERCKLAEKFIEHALVLTKPVAGMVVMLGRPDFDFAVTRRHLFGEHPAFAGRLNMSHRPRWIEGSTGGPRFPYSWFWWDWKKLKIQQPVTIYDYDGGRDD